MILCCGEALIDMIPSQTVAGDQSYVPRSGGSVFNTAIALGRLRVSAGMLTGLSSDLFGQQLSRDLRASDVDYTQSIICDRPTTLAFVRLSNGHASYTFYDENSAGRMVQASDFPDLDVAVSALYFGGISLACEPSGTTYAALAERVYREKVIMLDANIRPDFIEEELAFRKRLKAMLTMADIVKVSDEDLHWIFPGRETAEEKVAHLRTQSSGIVILTRGSAGASAWSVAGDKVDVDVPSVKIVDTVGAGDTFNAGVLAYLCERSLLSKLKLPSITPSDLSAALTFGTSVARVTVSRSGANPPWRSELTLDAQVSS